MQDENTTEKISKSTRRKLLKMSSGAGAGIFALSGVGAASKGEKDDDESGGESTRLTREEKAAQEGVEWDEDWVDEDMIGKASFESERKISFDASSGRPVGGTFTINGIDIGVEGYLGEWEGWIEVTIFNQSRRTTFTRSSVCANDHFDAGAAYVDGEWCANWDDLTIEQSVNACVWHVSGWSCMSRSNIIK